jgi:hypothetical protein
MTENGSGKYLYCVIGTERPLELPLTGVNGAQDQVHTIHMGGLAVVVSDARSGSYRFDRSTAMAHQSVIQEVMRRFTTLPFRFGTVADSEEEVRGLLARYGEEFQSRLQYLGDKAEYGLKALWRDREQPFQEILAELEDIRRYRDAIGRRPAAETYQERIQIGRMVKEALEAKREAESRCILERLQPLAAEARVNATLMDEMILNAAFLLVKGTEPPFEEALLALDGEYQGRVRFRLVGPSPPFNFVDMPISWQ